MKNKINIYCKLICIFSVAVALFSCDYEELAEADYPESLIYMPASYSGVYDISAAPDASSVPTEGAPSRYYVDESNSTLEIPLGVFRGGVYLDGEVTVNLVFNTDTVSQLITAGSLPETSLLPMSALSLPETVKIADGENLGTFNLKVDMSFLKSHATDKFAIGIEISSEDREVNPDLKTTVVYIDPEEIE